MAALRFELVTPERLVRSEEVFMVVVPGSEGDFSVLTGHAPYMSTLRNGDIAVYRSGFGDTPERIPVEGGFAEVNDRGLTVLAERVDVAASV
jgi:F-type H+-transporting ATPase subunit epsilon